MDRVHSEMLDSAQKYIEIVHERGKKGLELERVYRNIRQPGLFLLAYNELYATHGATTEGTAPEDDIQKMSLELIESIIRDLEQGTYRWKPSRRIYVEKPNGGLRPISIPCWKDKLLQGAIRLVLNAYYEPQFSDCSHGFRLNRGCHTALGEIVKRWWGTVWFVEGDIKGCFDNIDREKLQAIMGRKIKDERLMKLLKEMLKAGYREDWVHKRSYSGTPQGGVITPPTIWQKVFWTSRSVCPVRICGPTTAVGLAVRRWRSCGGARMLAESKTMRYRQPRRRTLAMVRTFEPRQRQPTWPAEWP